MVENIFCITLGELVLVKKQTKMIIIKFNLKTTKIKALPGGPLIRK